ncbi:MAG: 23S rRNA (guanosine(2251)-2'-O)-methyltransferase RlmB [Zetaproteobacteria bacterium]|nr:MAG: 23S rRNA (guanosine(2251)-2'-O)-methyltransferase RlmB [Zetaproteobacteria bacterium]
MSWRAGIHAVAAALAARRVRALWISATSRNPRVWALAEEAAAQEIPVHKAPQETLDRLARGIPHQGIVAEVLPPPRPDLRALVKALAAETNPVVLALDGVTDPRNLGASARSALAFGAQALIVPKDRSAHPDHPAAAKAAAGALDLLPVVVVPNLVRALEALREAGLWIVGLAGEAEATLYDAPLDQPCAIVAGSEDQGLRRLVRKRCDLLARIPMHPAAESLNVAVAASIALFEARRRRA